MAFDIENINNSAWDAMFEMVQSGNVDTAQLLHVAASQYLLEVQDIEKDLISFTDLLKLRSKYSKIAKNGGVLSNNEIFQLTNTKLMISDFLQGDIPHKLYNAAFSF